MGFFNLLEDAPTIRGDERVSSKVAVKRSTLSCEDCRLSEGCHSPKLRFTGEGQKQVLIVGTRPSYDEDDAGELGSGLEYRFIRDTLRQLGIDMAKDCYYTTAINCAPSKNRAPNFTEISACRPRLVSLINKLKPVSIILLGETGFDSLIEPRLSGRITGLAFSAFVGEHIPDQEYKTWLTPIWSVASMMERKSYDDGNESKPRYERDIAFYGMWKDHIYEAFNLQPVTLADYKDQCIITQDEATAIKWIEQAMSWKRMAFDYETTGRKPHREGQKIWSVSISDGYASYSFPFFTSDKFKAAWKALMLSDVKKIAQNLSYEMLWTYVQCGYWVANWEWDTMLAQHCLSNQKPTGLKFMVYTEFGHSGYDDEVDEYLKATAAEEKLHGANAINQIHRAPMEPLLTYGALDSFYTFKLADRQSARISAFQRKGFEFFMESAQTLTIAQANGFNVTLDKLQEVQEELDAQMLVQHQKIMGSPLLGQWTDGAFNYQSSPQLSKLLYEIMGLTPTKYTDAKKPSVDEETLAKLDVPIIKDILAYRKLFKMRNTYIAQYKTEVIGGKIHPYFNINRVDTFRSCVAKGSKILVARDFVESPEGVPIEDVRVGEYVYSFDDALRPVLKKVLWAGKTGHRNVIRLHYKAGRRNPVEMHLDVTPEHLVRMVDGEYMEAQYLLDDFRDRADPKWRYQPKSRVLSIARQGDRIFPTNSLEVKEYRFIYEQLSGENLKPDDVIHHENGNHLDHTFSNLCKMDNRSHAAEHYKDTLGTDSSRAKNIEVLKALHKAGGYTYLKGADSPQALGLTRTECLRLFIKHRGILNNKEHDFATYLWWCDYNGLDIHKLQVRFNSNHEYISRWKLLNALKGGVRKAQRSLSVGRYKLKELCDYYGVDSSLYFRGSKYLVSPWKDATINNHIITGIEVLPDAVDVYDLEVEDTHNFIANEICVHNSANAPNVQNQPKRDKNAKKLLREFITPSKGNRIVEMDYRALEVSGNCMYSKDPTLIKYLLDPTADMHRASAADCFMLKPEEVTKALRGDVKGQFVFAEFYGSFYKQVAKDLWETAEVHNLRQHLYDKGIRNFEDFERHIQEAERILWEDRFPVHNEWRESQWKFYQKHGYVELKTGFKCYGPMSRNNTFNTPVQGSSYHILQWTMNQVNKKVMRLERSRIIGEIHDSCIFDAHPSEQDLIDYWYWDYGTQKVREHWDWINVPLTIEKEHSEIDGSWAEMSEAGALKGDC